MANSNNNIGYFPQMPVCDKHFFSELSSDFSLPDYQPEIKRLLSTRISLLPPSEYLGNSNASLSAEAHYHVLYLGADNKLYCLKLTDNYSFDVPFEFNSHCVDTDSVSIIPHSCAESVNVRVLGPRKLNIKSKIKTRVLATSPMMYSALSTERHLSSSIEKNIYEVPCLVAKRYVSEPNNVSDFIPMDLSLDTLRVIDVCANVLTSECTASSDKIHVKGEMVVKILYCNDMESDEPLSIFRKVPFSCALACDEVDSAFSYCALGNICESNVEITEQGLNVELSYLISVSAQKNISVPYINDAYSTECSCESKSSPLFLLSAFRTLNGALTQNDVFNCEEIKLPKYAKIINTDARANILELCAENGKLFFKGECVYQLSYWLDGEYLSIQQSAPIKYEIDLRSSIDDVNFLRWSASATPLSVRARCDEKRMFVDCELQFSAILQCEDEIEILSELNLGEKHKKSRGEVILCYPEKDATLWQIGKHYKQSIKKIRAQNSLGEADNAPKSKFLVI